MKTPSSFHVGPAVAGSWYPASPQALADVVDGLFERAGTAPQAPAAAIVAPHAGYIFSGLVAAKVFRPIGGVPFRRVILLGPSHYTAFRGARVPDAEVYRTPLGEVPIDREAVALLVDGGHAVADNRPFAREHSLECEIPFLQRSPGGAAEFSVVPVLIGPYSSPAELGALAAALRPLAGHGVPVVVSSDFTHYGEAFGYVPFRGDVPENLRELDHGAVEAIVAGDAEAFRTYCDETGATICGRHAIEVLLRLWPEGARGRLVDYDTSGRMTGDWGHSVSYAGLAIERGAAA